MIYSFADKHFRFDVIRNSSYNEAVILLQFKKMKTKAGATIDVGRFTLIVLAIALVGCAIVLSIRHARTTTHLIAPSIGENK